MFIINSSLLRFLIVGSLSTAINYGTFAVLLLGIDMPYVPSSVVGYITGMMLGYALNRTWAFRTLRQIIFAEVVLYILIYLGSLVLNTLTLLAVVEGGGLLPLWGNIIAIVVSTGSNYLGLRYLVFDAQGSRKTIVDKTSHE